MHGIATSGLRVRLFGALGFEAAGARVDITSVAQRRILGRLALSAGQMVSIDTLVDLLWPDDPPRTAVASVQSQMYRLRMSLGADAIRTSAPGYFLDVDRDEVDVHRFDRLLSATGEEGQASALDLARLDEALALWRGRPLEEFADESWARPSVVWLTERHVVAQERRIGALLVLGQVDDAVAASDGLCEAEPLREHAHGLLMLALARQGRAFEALRVFDRFRKRLVRETGLEPSPALAAIEQEVLGAADGSVPEAARAGVVGSPRRVLLGAGRLPAEVNQLVGRHAEVAALMARVPLVPTLTLTGPGGVGKTRLAVHVARQAAGLFFDGACFVDLAPIVKGENVSATIGSALVATLGTATDLDEVVERLAEKQLLIVLDCCEHVVGGAAAAAATITAGCPGVRVLATSREPLGISGEEVFALDPLDAEAAELFAARAAAARRGFRLTASNRATVTAICSALDGLPLAIELAAARCDHMTLDEIHAQLGHRFALLKSGRRDASPRHQGLARAIDWSWDLLEAREQTLLTRASVFSGGWTADAAVAVCAVDDLGRPDVELLLGALVRKSLVVARLDGERARYRMLDSIRAYCADRLAERGDEMLVARRHAEWVAEVLAEMADLLMSAREADGARWRDAELANLTTGLAWALEHGGLDLAMRCLRPVLWVGHQLPLVDTEWSNDSVIGWRDHPDSPYLWLRTARRARNPDESREAAFECSRHDDLPLHIRALAHVNAIRIRRTTGWISDPSETTENLTELRRLATGSLDPRVRFYLTWGEFLVTAYRSEEREVWVPRLRLEAQATAIPTLIGTAEVFIGAGGADEGALRALHTAIEIFEGVGNSIMAAAAHNGFPDQVRPDARFLAETVKFTRNVYREGLWWFLRVGRNRAELLALHGRPVIAATIAGALEGLRAAGFRMPSLSRSPLVDRAVAEWPEAVQRGRALTLEEAATLTLTELESVLAELEERGNETEGGDVG